jgi:hypothetical protein
MQVVTILRLRYNPFHNIEAALPTYKYSHDGGAGWARHAQDYKES